MIISFHRTSRRITRYALSPTLSVLHRCLGCIPAFPPSHVSLFLCSSKVPPPPSPSCTFKPNCITPAPRQGYFGPAKMTVNFGLNKPTLNSQKSSFRVRFAKRRYTALESKVQTSSLCKNRRQEFLLVTLVKQYFSILYQLTKLQVLVELRYQSYKCNS